MTDPSSTNREQKRVWNFSGSSFCPPLWLRSPHTQTLWGPLIHSGQHPPLHLEVLETPDSDQIRFWSYEGNQSKSFVLIFHGLEGSASSHYILSMIKELQKRQYGIGVIEFRACGEMNLLPRMYMAGDSEEADWILEFVTQRFAQRPIHLFGYSLGGNVFCKWLGERGTFPQVKSLAAISPPLNLEITSKVFNTALFGIYGHSTMKSIKIKAREKAKQYPCLFRLDRAMASKTIMDFDDAVTAPTHDFKGHTDYYRASSAVHTMEGIKTPTLILSADDDPLVPMEAIPKEMIKHHPFMQGLHTKRGGHVGWVDYNHSDGHHIWSNRVLLQWLDDHTEE